MDILKIEHLAPYIPYGLKGINTVSDEDKFIQVNGLYVKENEQPSVIYKSKSKGHCDCFLTYFKPILRPLSDLYKTFEHDSKTIDMCVLLGANKDNLHFENDNNEFIIYLSINNRYNSMIPLSIKKQLLLFKYHFDVFGLIEKGLAQDINLLKE